jgi:hypothetical protein
VAQVVEHLASKCESLSFKHQYHQKKERKEKPNQPKKKKKKEKEKKGFFGTEMCELKPRRMHKS